MAMAQSLWLGRLQRWQNFCRKNLEYPSEYFKWGLSAGCTKNTDNIFVGLGSTPPIPIKTTKNCRGF